MQILIAWHALLILLLVSSATAETKTNRERVGLIGAVQTVTTVTTIAGRVGERVVSHYDANGHETEVVRYNDANVLMERSAHTYNATGYRIETTTKNAADELLTRTLYLYDLQGRLNEMTTLDGAGIIDKTTYTYDMNKHTVDETTTYTHRSITVRVTRWYDKKGQETQSFTFGRGSSVTKTTFAYDPTGNLTERRVYAVDGALLDHLRYTYEFDAVGNWISQTELLCNPSNESTTDSCTPTAVVTRTITYAGQKNPDVQ